MMAISAGPAIAEALQASGKSQRRLAAQTGISQSTLSRIIAGDRVPKMSELILLAEATGFSIGQLTGSAAAKRVECAARSTNGAGMEAMRQRLLSFVELDAYLDDQAID